MELVEVFVSEIVKKKKSELVVYKKKDFKKTNDLKYFTANEIKTLILKTDKGFYKYIYQVLFETGARIEELREVSFKDIDIENNRMRVKTLKQKELTYRSIPFSAELKAALLQYKLLTELCNDDFILAKKTGKPPLTRQGITTQLKNDCLKFLDLKNNINVHRFRHSRAIFLLNNKVNLVQLQKFLGHSDIRNTLIYLKYADEHFDNAIQSANNEFYK